MQCELCGKEITKGERDCNFCTTPENCDKIEGVLNDTILFLSQQVKIEKGQGELHYKVGNFHRLSGRYDDALLCYERALQSDQTKEQWVFGTFGPCRCASRQDCH